MVGKLVSEYTAKVSEKPGSDQGFDADFPQQIEAAVARIREEEPYHHHDGEGINKGITRAEVRAVVRKLKKKLFKSPGPDGLTNWMLVWGGEKMVAALHALYAAAWEAGVSANCLPVQG